MYDICPTVRSFLLYAFLADKRLGEQGRWLIFNMKPNQVRLYFKQHCSGALAGFTFVSTFLLWLPGRLSCEPRNMRCYSLTLALPQAPAAEEVPAAKVCQTILFSYIAF